MVEKERGGVERAEESRKSDLFKGVEKKKNECDFCAVHTNFEN